jgi:predicted transport protein
MLLEMKMNQSINPQLQTMIDNMPEKTGKSLSEWQSIIADAGLSKHGEILKLLKGEYGITHGFANTISSLYREQLAGGSPSGDDLIEQQYSGKKAGLRTIYDALLAAVSKFGSDVEVAPKKSYVSLRRNKQFAIVKAATQNRVDLGLNLKGVEPTNRLEGGKVFSGMCTHKVQLLKSSDVDDNVISWLKQAYEQS